MYIDDQSFTGLLDACAQNVGKRPRVATDENPQIWQGTCSQILSILGLHVEWRKRRAAPHDCQIDSEAGRRHFTVAVGQELYILHPVWQGKHHA